MNSTTTTEAIIAELTKQLQQAQIRATEAQTREAELIRKVREAELNREARETELIRESNRFVLRSSDGLGGIAPDEMKSNCKLEE